LDKSEVDKMQKEAESHAEDDRRRKDEAEERNRTDTMVYNTEKILSENREKIPAEEASQIERAIEDAKKALQEGDIQAVRNSREGLEKASHRLAEVMYQRAGAQAEGAQPPPGADQEQQAGSAGSAPPDEGEVIDAEIVDSDEKK
jgi:molecular chaperone DnaK